MDGRRRALLNNSGVRIIDEPFHTMRNKIIEDLQGGWFNSEYWQRFKDKDLLKAVMTRMQSQGELICRFNGEYEWFVPHSARPQKMVLPEVPK